MFFLAAQHLSAGQLPRQPRPPTARLQFGAQHQDLPWILLLLLELLLTPRLPLVHHQSHLDLGHPSMLLTAARIPSVHPHRSPPGQLVSHLVFQGMLFKFHSPVVLLLLDFFCFHHLHLFSRHRCHFFIHYHRFVSFYSFLLFVYCTLSRSSLPIGFFWFLYWLSSHSLSSIFSPYCSRRPPGAPSHRPTIIRPAEPSLLD